MAACARPIAPSRAEAEESMEGAEGEGACTHAQAPFVVLKHDPAENSMKLSPLMLCVHSQCPAKIILAHMQRL